MDLPEQGRYRFAVYPRNCSGAAGKPSYWSALESEPGMDKTKHRNGE